MSFALHQEVWVNSRGGQPRDVLPDHGRSMMHDGLGCLTGSPADSNCPVFGSMRNTATLFPGMLAQRSHWPSGVTARFCGPFPRLGWMAISDNRPSSPIVYAA